MSGLDCIYVDNVLVLTTGMWNDHLRKLDTVLHCVLAKAGLKVNATKSAFGKPEIEYLRFWITAAVSNLWQKRLRQFMPLPLQTVNSSDALLVLLTTTIICGSAYQIAPLTLLCLLPLCSVALDRC